MHKQLDLDSLKNELNMKVHPSYRSLHKPNLTVVG